MSCYNSTLIDAPIEKVWEEIRNFHNLLWAKGVIETLDEVGDKKGLEVGAKRIINGVFYETLTELRSGDFYFKYSVDDGPGAVAKDAVRDYFAEVKLQRITDTNQTFMLWTSTYQSKDERAVAELFNPIYQALLSAAKDNITK
jgi:hypothetical protein